MSLNIKPLENKDHPDVSYPDKVITETEDKESESKKDYRKGSDNKPSVQDKLTKKLKNRFRKKIDPKKLLKRLNII